MRLGLGSRAIDHRIADGRLHPLHCGVYAVGHPLVSRAGAWMAAVLAAGPCAVLSHHAAAALWGIRETRRSTPDVIAPRRVDRPRMNARRIALPPDEATLHRGDPGDHAGPHAPGPRRDPEPAPARSGDHRGGDRRLAVLPPSPTCRAPPRTTGSPPSGHPSGRRPRAHHPLRPRGRIPRVPRRPGLRPTNHRIELPSGEPCVDAASARPRLVAELDSYGIHHTPQLRGGPGPRSGATAAGWRVVRITWRQLHHDATTLATQLRALLGG